MATNKTVKALVDAHSPYARITHKICSKCGRKKPIEEFHKGTGRGGRCAQCKECCHLYFKKHYHTCESYQKRVKERARKWYRDNPDRVRQWRKVYYERRNVVRNRETEELHDHYVVQLLLAQGIERKDITPAMIEIKRKQVADSRRYRRFMRANEVSGDINNSEDINDSDNEG